jgi:hypothetical protein
VTFHVSHKGHRASENLIRQDGQDFRDLSFEISFGHRFCSAEHADAEDIPS